MRKVELRMTELEKYKTIKKLVCWLPNYLNMQVNNLITLNEKVIPQVWIISIQIMCYDFYNIFYRKWEKRVKPTHANEFFLRIYNKATLTASHLWFSFIKDGFYFSLW